jgi:hypothetical protein
MVYLKFFFFFLKKIKGTATCNFVLNVARFRKFLVPIIYLDIWTQLKLACANSGPQIFTLQFINVYAPKYETAGKFWPTVHNSMIFSLVLMHAIAVGIFTLKKLSVASTLIFPLAVLTLLFNEYCRKRFLPIFTAYPAEVCLRVQYCETLSQRGAKFSHFFPHPHIILF